MAKQEDKTVMLQMMGRIYVGKPVMETFKQEEDSPETELMVEVSDAFEFMPIATLMQDPGTGQTGTLSTFAIVKVGTIINIPDEAVVAELSADSAYYKDYVKALTGITTAPSRIQRPH